MFQVPGKSQDRKFTAAMAIPTPKSTPASTRFEAPSPKAKVSPGHDNRRKGQPRAIVLVNACWRTLTAFSQGDWPATCANAADARIRDEQNATEADRSQRETDFFGRLSSLPASSFQMTRAGHRIGIQRHLSPDLAERDGERREPKVEVAASCREAPVELHEYAQSPGAESRMLSASSDQGQSCCHFPSLLVSEESSESRFLLLLLRNSDL